MYQGRLPCRRPHVTMASPMRTTFYPRLKSPRSWYDEEHAWPPPFASHKVIADKDAAPLFSPAELIPGTKRANENVVKIHYGVLDLDGLSEQDLVRYLRFDLQFLLFTTHSHGCQHPHLPRNEKNRCPECGKKLGAWRLVFPFSRPVLPTEWEAFWPRMNQYVASGKGDYKCTGASHAYYVPSVPSEADMAFAVVDINDGAVLDVDAVLALAVRPEASAARAATKIAALSLQSFRDAARRQKRHMKERFDALIRGEAFAQAGERNTVSFQMMRDLARALPNVEPEAIRTYLTPSIEAMGPDDGFNVDVVLRQFATAQEDILEEEVEAENAAREALANDIERAFHGTPYHGRRTPYSDEELALMREALEVSDSHMKHMWVLQKGSSFYALLGGEYVGPYHGAETPAIHVLAPASSAGVERCTRNKNGLVYKDWAAMANDYGTVVNKVVVDISAKSSRFDVATRTMYEAPCPLRDLEPRFDAEIDQWCRHFAGDQYDKFIAWLASVPTTSEPTAVLFIKAQKGSGKSMLMAGLGRLWLRDEDPPPITSTMIHPKEFNSDLTKCPLTVADEDFPPNRTAELRRFMQARTHVLKRKFMPDATVFGSIRVVIAANNKELLKIRDVLTQDDISALAERILYLEPLDEAREYLRSLGDKPKRWVKESLLARHVLWLHQNHVFEQGNRFLVEGEQDSFHRSLAVSTALSSALCEWVARFLRDPARAAQGDAATVVVQGDDILISPSGVAQYWDLYTTNFFPKPELRDVSTALRSITTKERRVVKVKGKATHFRVIDQSFLQQWADDNDWGDLV